MTTVTDVHKDLRKVAAELIDAGCRLERHGAHKVDVYKDGVVVTTMPSASKTTTENPERERRKLRRLGLLPAEGGVRRTRIELELREAAARRGHRERRQDEQPPPPDPVDGDRGPRRPRDLGVLRPYDHRRAPAPKLRYIGNAAWGDYVARRVKKAIEVKFDGSPMQFIDWAITVAQERHLPPPNTRRGAQREPWDRERIRAILRNLLERRNAKSMTLQFFQAAVDELDGVPGGNYLVSQPGDGEQEKSVIEQADEGKIIGIKVFADECDEPEVTPGEPTPEAEHHDTPESPSATQESPEPSPSGDLRLRLAGVLLEKLETGEAVDEALVDRIEKLIGE